jgi:esterase/lipase
MDLDDALEINPSTYEWSVRIVTILKKILRLNLKLHHKGQVDAGDIFLFNHFARFETFIPQYLIYQETGALCRSLASKDFFVEGSAFSNYLLNVGTVPNDHPRLLPFLAEEILRGRKVIVFPEGGMVKDRRVMDTAGHYSVYSRMAKERRKHHSGAAVLALALDAFKTAILEAHKTGNTKRLETWGKTLGMDSEDQLLAAARRPTLIVPANITFYPIRVSDNILRRVGEVVSRGLSRRLSEELLIEGNILLKDTDMDVRLGEPVRPPRFWRWWERKLLIQVSHKIDSLDGFFELPPEGGSWNVRIIARRMRDKVEKVRDEYMHRMYTGVTVNLSHLASSIILMLVDKGQREVDQALFHKILYLAVKHAQEEPSMHLHRSLKSPEFYRGVLEGRCLGLERFLKTTTSMALVERENGRYRFLPKLLKEHEFDEIRIENLVLVYANEAEPIFGVSRSVEQSIVDAPVLHPQRLAKLRFDDELVAYNWDRQYFSKPRYEEINQQETATESGEPFLFLPEGKKELGVVLVHGFSASPAEVRPFAEKLYALGYPVIGVRLKGHGTSPWDLRERNWQDWLDPVQEGYKILSAFAPRLCLVGFSTGGSLSLLLAADQPENLVGVVSISAPMKFRDRNIIFVPLVHTANKLVRWVSSYEGVMPFRATQPEHPHINYRNKPVRGLYELRAMLDELDERLVDVQCPVTLIQGTDDPTVDAQSAEMIHKKLGARQKEVVRVDANRHGILYEDIGETQERIVSFLRTLSSKDDASEIS